MSRGISRCLCTTHLHTFCIQTTTLVSTAIFQDNLDKPVPEHCHSGLSLELRMTELVVTTAAIRCTKLQPNCHHQQTSIRLFTGRIPFLLPNQQCQHIEGENLGNVSYFADLLTPSSPGGLPTLSLTTKGSSWLALWCQYYVLYTENAYKWTTYLLHMHVQKHSGMQQNQNFTASPTCLKVSFTHNRHASVFFPRMPDLCRLKTWIGDFPRTLDLRRLKTSKGDYGP